MRKLNCSSTKLLPDSSVHCLKTWKKTSLLITDVIKATVTCNEGKSLHRMWATPSADCDTLQQGYCSQTACGFSPPYTCKHPPGDLSMAWWRFMGSTAVVMFSPSASNRLLWVRASPVSDKHSVNWKKWAESHNYIQRTWSWKQAQLQPVHYY